MLQLYSCAIKAFLIQLFLHFSFAVQTRITKNKNGKKIGSRGVSCFVNYGCLSKPPNCSEKPILFDRSQSALQKVKNQFIFEVFLIITTTYLLVGAYYSLRLSSYQLDQQAVRADSKYCVKNCYGFSIKSYDQFEFEIWEF